MFKNRWNFLYLILAVVVLFSLFAVPQIAISNMNAVKGEIVTVQP